MDSDIESSTPNDSPNPKHQQRRLSGIVNSDTKSEHSVSGSGMQVSAYHMKSFAPHAMWIHVAALHRVYVTIILLEYIWKSISRYYRRRVRFLFFFSSSLIFIFTKICSCCATHCCHSQKQQRATTEKTRIGVRNILFSNLHPQHIIAILLNYFHFSPNVWQEKKNVSRCHLAVWRRPTRL